MTPLGATLLGVLGGLLLAALLFLMVCLVCAAVLGLLHAVLPVRPSDEGVATTETAGTITPDESEPDPVLPAR